MAHIEHDFSGEVDQSNPEAPTLVPYKMGTVMDKVLDLTPEKDTAAPSAPKTENYNIDRERELIRGDLARGLLMILVFAVGGVLAFIGLGRIDGEVLSQSIFPSLIALAGTALGFYFGAQAVQAGQSYTGAPSRNTPPKEEQ